MSVSIKRFNKFDWILILYIIAFFIVLLFLLNTPPTPDEGTYSLISLYFHDLFSNLIKYPTLSFTKIYNYTISYLIHYPKLSLYYPPLLNIIISFFYDFMGISFQTGRFVVLLFSAGALFILYKLLKKFFSKKIALLSTILFSIMPLILYDSITVMTDIPYTFFFLLAMYFYLKAFDTKQCKYFIFAAVTVALSFLTKWNSILIVPIIFIYALLEKRSQMKNVIISIVFIFLIISPYLFIIWKTGLAGIPFISSLKISATAKANPQFTSVEGWTYYFDALASYYFTLPVLIATVLALVFYATQKEKHWKLLIIWFLTYYLFFTFLSNKEPRYMMPLIPTLLIPLSYFILSEKGKMLVGITIVIIALIGYSTYQLISQTFYYNPDFIPIAKATLQSNGNILVADEPGWFYSSQFIFTLASLDKNISKTVYRSCSLQSLSLDNLLSNYGIGYVIVSKPTDIDIGNVALVESSSNLQLINQFVTNTTDVSLYIYNNYTRQKQYCNFICVLNSTICTNYQTPVDALK
jgi:4-amino-4-deoxy-L-arabinose transferase-like glycosyltransferase